MTTTAFKPAIKALRSDLASLEQRAAETRTLIEQLCARAGIELIERAEAKKRQAVAAIVATAIACWPFVESRRLLETLAETFREGFFFPRPFTAPLKWHADTTPLVRPTGTHWPHGRQLARLDL
jgi:hypothetical protein